MRRIQNTGTYNQRSGSNFLHRGRCDYFAGKFKSSLSASHDKESNKGIIFRQITKSTLFVVSKELDFLEMQNHKTTHLIFSPNLDLTSRVALVAAAYQTQGHINRQILVETYAVTQVQAGGLMRDFIEANAKTIEWFPEKTHYKLNDKK